MAEELTFLFEETLVVRWADMDALGHVNNAKYLTYLETVRVGWFDSLSLKFGEEGLGVVLARVEIDYLLPILYPAKLVLRMYSDRPGRTSLCTHYEILDADNNEICYSRSKAILVWVDLDLQKSVPLPEVVTNVFDC